MKLHTVKPNPYATKARKRVGRGPGSGTGKTAGRGENGQNSRSGGGVRVGFEGGQTPLFRRLPKRGFSNANFKKVYATINLSDLNKFEDGAEVTPEILKDMGMNIEDRTEIMMAIGNHDEATGTAVSDISAALILADKSDVHRARVRNQNMSTFDKHDKVNYAVTNADFTMNKEERKITLSLTIDRDICPMLDYFEIFMDRTMMSKYAAKYLNIWFELLINGTKLL